MSLSGNLAPRFIQIAQPAAPRHLTARAEYLHAKPVDDIDDAPATRQVHCSAVMQYHRRSPWPNFK